MKKNWHIIDTYSHAKEMILCACGWKGSAGEAWLAHRKEMRDSEPPKGFDRKDYVYSPGLKKGSMF